jgi:hypothetical protein
LEKRVVDMHGDEVPILKDRSQLKGFNCEIKKRTINRRGRFFEGVYKFPYVIGHCR